MTMTPTSPAELAVVYCTDEDIAVICYADFVTLAPKDQILAQGSDGVFTPEDLWTLNSAGTDFNAQGLAVGNIVQLLGPTPPFKGSGFKYAVAAVNPNQVTLRRVGQPPNFGQPIAPAGGITGVSFLVTTFTPQIQYASYDINQRYGIDPNFALIAPQQIYDPRALQQVTAMTVVVWAYETDTRSKDGDFANKLRRFACHLDGLLARYDLKWNTATGENPLPITRFNMKYGR
jgi:hypothetical protein